jgi:hypothetical protein
MKMPILGGTKLNWGDWLYGLFAGFIGGGASAITSGIVLNISDPGHFNGKAGEFYTLIGTMFLTNGALSAFFYLKQHPLPDIKVVTTVETVERQMNPPAVIKTTVEETVTKPQDQPKP